MRLGWSVALGYLVRGAYHFLTTSGQPVDRTMVDDVCWDSGLYSPWRADALASRALPELSASENVVICVKFLCWENGVLQHVLHHTDTTCISRCGNSETTTHLFLHCDTFDSLWSHVRRWLQISSVLPGDIRQLFIQFTYMAGLPRFTHSFLKIIWFALVWVLWKEKNDRVFKNTVSDPLTLIEKVKLHSFLC
ncbi:transmembrane protein, putative [Medicago truncatula]|uniref:Transmembrane protein, putative n=1 Tax=Medicago truncatula TaxID=3880 RepID=G7JX41_MEDTR|nr:transmembrane protein, putative [Medicago truncatula]